MGEDEKETNRVLLQIFHERNNQLANMLIALNGFILAFIAGMLALIIGDLCKTEKIIPLIIAINIVIAFVVFWRFYSHYIDDDIVKGYQKIFRCEYLLDVDKNLTLLHNFEKGILNLKSYDARVGQKICPSQKFEEKMLIIENLTKEKKLGYRGHYWFNVITILVISVLLITEAILLRYIIRDLPFIFIIGIIALSLIIVIFFCCHLHNYLKFCSKEIRTGLRRCSMGMVLLVCIAITFSFLISLNLNNFFKPEWNIFFFGFKDLFIFAVLAYLVFCYAHKDPSDNDLRQR